MSESRHKLPFPVELRLLISNNIDRWSDYMAFRHTDQINLLNLHPPNQLFPSEISNCYWWNVFEDSVRLFETNRSFRELWKICGINVRATESMEWTNSGQVRNFHDALAKLCRSVSQIDVQNRPKFRSDSANVMSGISENIAGFLCGELILLIEEMLDGGRFYDIYQAEFVGIDHKESRETLMVCIDILEFHNKFEDDNGKYTMNGGIKSWQLAVEIVVSERLLCFILFIAEWDGKQKRVYTETLLSWEHDFEDIRVFIRHMTQLKLGWRTRNVYKYGARKQCGPCITL